jgi:Lon protease-like protein
VNPSNTEIPLFPLKTVLFPGGPMPLKIFEARYLDMVGRCIKGESGFGVIAILDGPESGDGDVSINKVGTMARIVDWYRMDDGLLGITAVGESRFLLRSLRCESDKLRVGEVGFVEPDISMPIPSRYRPMSRLLEKMLTDSGPYYHYTGWQLDDAAWVGYRLAEMLPLSLEQRQTCLEISDPVQRLEIIYPVLEAATKQKLSKEGNDG